MKNSIRKSKKITFASGHTHVEVVGWWLFRQVEADNSDDLWSGILSDKDVLILISEKPKPVPFVTVTEYSRNGPRGPDGERNPTDIPVNVSDLLWENLARYGWKRRRQPVADIVFVSGAGTSYTKPIFIGECKAFEECSVFIAHGWNDAVSLHELLEQVVTNFDVLIEVAA